MDISIRKHKLVADEPPEIGGGDLGPNPIELLLASVASCLSMVIKMYAEDRGIKVNKIEVKAVGSLDIRGLMGEDVKPDLQSIDLEVVIDSPASRKELLKLLDIVEKHCPVADTLKSATPVKIVLK